MGLPIVVTYAILVAVAALTTLQNRRRIWALMLVVAALSFPMALSLSRGSWLAAGVGVVVIIALGNWKKSMHLLVLVCGVALVIMLSIPGNSSEESEVLTERFTSIYSVKSAPDQSVQDRYAMWHAALGIWADHPLTGVGVKNFPYFRDVYIPLDFSGGSDIADPSGGFRRVALLSPHNLYLLILAEQGLVGALAFGTLLLSLGITGVRRVLNMKVFSVEKVFGLSAMGAMAAFFVNSVWGDPGGSGAVLEPAVLIGGMVWLASGVEPEEEVQ